MSSFIKVPTLKTLPLIGHSHLFLPKSMGGKYSIDKLTEAMEDISKQLGSPFRLNLGGVNMFITLDAEHTKCMYRHEGKLPVRPPFDALIKYRKEIFNSVGVVPGNGEEWHKFRSGVNPLLKLELVKKYEPKFAEVSAKFIDFIEKKTSGNSLVTNIYEDLLLYAIQAISVVSPGNEFDCLSVNKSAGAADIIQASIDFMEGLHSTLIGAPIWKWYKTVAYRKLETSHNKIHEVISKDMQEHFNSYQSNLDFQMTQPFLYHLFNNPRLSYEDCVMLAMETFLGGIDAVATTLSFTLWFLAQDKDLQNRVRDDTSDEYLKSCLRETLRLKTTAGANSRFLPKDVEIAGYLVPKGTLIMSFVSAMGNSSKYFEDAEKYKPERWFRSVRENIHPFASLPFGYGARMCPGRRLAESEMIILLRLILENFELSLLSKNQKDIGMIYRLNRIPEQPININFRKLTISSKKVH